MVHVLWFMSNQELFVHTLDICHAIHFATLDEATCTLTLNATAPMNVSLGMYGVAIQLEDYASHASTKPLSSVSFNFGGFSFRSIMQLFVSGFQVGLQFVVMVLNSESDCLVG